MIASSSWFSMSFARLVAFSGVRLPVSEFSAISVEG